MQDRILPKACLLRLCQAVACAACAVRPLQQHRTLVTCSGTRAIGATSIAAAPPAISISCGVPTSQCVLRYKLVLQQCECVRTSFVDDIAAVNCGSTPCRQVPAADLHAASTSAAPHVTPLRHYLHALARSAAAHHKVGDAAARPSVAHRIVPCRFSLATQATSVSTKWGNAQLCSMQSMPIVHYVCSVSGENVTSVVAGAKSSISWYHVLVGTNAKLN